MLKTGALLALLVLATISVSPSAAQAPAFLYQWGSTGDGNGQFRSPTYAAVDANQDVVYVADGYNHRIQKFTRNGTYVSQWGSSDWISLSPVGVAVGAGGNVYVSGGSGYAAYENDNIKVFTSNGVLLTQWSGGEYGQLRRPYGIAIDASGNLYVVDRGNDRILVFSSNGAYVNQWGGAGDAAGLFTGPHGVAVDASGNVYVADTGNGRIQVFTSSGTYLKHWAVSGTPTGVAVDASGKVYVTQYGNGLVEMYTSSGASLGQFGTFNSPHGVTVDAGGNIYVVDASGDRIQVFGELPTSAANTTWGRLKADYR